METETGESKLLLLRKLLDNNLPMTALTHKEWKLWVDFQANLSLYKKETFSADDLVTHFSENRLKEVFKDPVHDKGIFFFKLLKEGEIQKVGEIYGRYNRSIKLYQVT